MSEWHATLSFLGTCGRTFYKLALHPNSFQFFSRGRSRTIFFARPHCVDRIEARALEEFSAGLASQHASTSAMPLLFRGWTFAQVRDVLLLRLVCLLVFTVKAHRLSDVLSFMSPHVICLWNRTPFNSLYLSDVRPVVYGFA